MKSRRLIHLVFIGCLGILLCTETARCLGQTPVESPETDSKPPKYSFFADVSGYSLNPDDSFSTFEDQGSGGAGPGGTFGMTIGQGAQRFSVSLTGRQKGHQFLADLSVRNVTGGADEDLKELSQTLNLTDLQPHVIDIAKDPDGRVYRVKILPRLIEHVQPKKFRLEDLGLDAWKFFNSAVILNDQDYIGTIGMTTDGSSVASLDIAGLANIEFSLTEMTDSKPEGVLRFGTISISHDGTLVQIRGVSNGKSLEQVPGPYLVYVRWKASSQKLDDARAMLRTQLTMLNAQIEKGDISIPKEALAALQKMADSDRAFILSSGSRLLLKNEIVAP